ncbi:MAG: sigma 54-interacting transcriptional regulator [Desulfococcaceae bacterium]
MPQSTRQRLLTDRDQQGGRRENWAARGWKPADLDVEEIYSDGTSGNFRRANTPSSTWTSPPHDRIAMRFREERRDDISFLKSGIETRNPAFNAPMERIERVAAPAADPMPPTGPTGAGKTAPARRIFELKRSRRQMSGRFAEVNGATLRGDMATSTPFGHEKAAFTGTVNRREGLLRAADGGVPFLDEAGELGGNESGPCRSWPSRKSGSCRRDRAKRRPAISSLSVERTKI